MTPSPVQPATTRQARKAQTRERLLAAARRVFARRGYHRALLEDVAEEAGFSTGAVYSNFAGKEDLFLTLLEELIEEQTTELAAAVAGGATVEARAEEGARMFTALLGREPELFLLFIEFWAQAVREPELRTRFAARYGRIREGLAELLETGARELGVELPLPPVELAIAIDALADGFALQKLADPEAIPDDLLGRAIFLLLRGAGVDVGPA
ncbi:MAG TPA: TetR family transcriptional regulator C-terminal domain-containing protein [Solirubrobacteraceae bacterium]